MGWVKLVETSELEDEDVIGVDVGGKKLAVCCTGDEYFVTSDICTHEYARLSEGYLDEDDGTIECPLHQAQFDVRTGRVCCGPAEDDIQTYPVKVEDGQIFVEIP